MENMDTSEGRIINVKRDSKMDVTCSFPYEIKNIPAGTNMKLKQRFYGQKQDFVRVIISHVEYYPLKGYLLWSSYREHATKIYNMEVRPDDVWIVSFPRSGSTVTQEMVWLLCNDVDIKTASDIPLSKRFAFIERETIIPGKMPLECEIYKTLEDMETQRFIFTHLPMSLAPARLAETARTVYVARDPRDVAVSFFHFYKLIKYLHSDYSFNNFWFLFKNDLVHWGPFFDHLKEAWELRKDPNVLFLFYEEISSDLPGTARRVAKFLGKQYSDEQFEKLCTHLNFENFKKNKAVNLEKEHPDGEGGSGFIRKGKVGGWKEYFDDEMTLSAEKWISDHLKDTDLRFPCELTKC